MSVLNNSIRAITFIYFLIIYKSSDLNNVNIYFMIFNLFLAYIPFELSVILNYSKNKIIIILLTILWLVFYPNAAYLLTDFFHLEALSIYETTKVFNSYLSDWALFSLLTFGILFGFSIGIISLFNVIKKMQDTFNYKKPLLTSGIFVILASFISGFAIYLGRFPRLHTHYLLSDPMKIIQIIIDNINMESIQFALIMSLWQIGLIGLFYLIKRNVVKEAQKNII